MNENSCYRETFESGKAKAAAFEKELWAIARDVAVRLSPAGPRCAHSEQRRTVTESVLSRIPGLAASTAICLSNPHETLLAPPWVACRIRVMPQRSKFL